MSADQAAQAAALLRQAFVAMQGAVPSQILGQGANDAEVNTSTRKEENVDSIPKPGPSADKPESSVQGAMKGSSKVPYCYRCYTKGHKMEDCIVQLYCEICDC